MEREQHLSDMESVRHELEAMERTGCLEDGDEI
jgi:hypothetical protein